MNNGNKDYRQNLCVSAVIMIFAVAAFLLSIPMPGNAPIFPRIASTFLFLCGAALFIECIKRHRRGEAPETQAVNFKTLKSPLVTLVLAVAYAIGFKHIGFYVSTLVIVIASMLYMGIRSIKTIAIVTGVLLIFLYWLFTIQLNVPLPHGLLL